jgi:AmmeMemoRadiSam system protein B
MANASVRHPAVAGMFYPSDPRALQSQVQEMLSRAVPLELIPAPKALVLPHAGYVYSGPVAATGYAVLGALRKTIRRVILLGPNHRVSLTGMALPASLSFATPLGPVEVDREHWQSLQARPGVVVDDRPHDLEHSLEVHLPFLQTVLERFTVTPVVVGQASAEAVAGLLDAVWGGPETLVVVSSDLSHYHPYHQARWCDQATVEQILSLRGGLDHQQACGATPVNGLMLASRRHGLQARLLDLRNSGDTSGDRQRVVGYASIAFCEGAPRVRH